MEELAPLAHPLPVLGHPYERRRVQLGDVLRGELAGNDLSAADQLIAKYVVGIRVRVDELVDARGRGDTALHLLEHDPRDIQAHEGVDEESLAAALHQTGVAPAPRAVGLQVRKAAAAEVVQTAAEGPAAHGWNLALSLVPFAA